MDFKGHAEERVSLGHYVLLLTADGLATPSHFISLATLKEITDVVIKKIAAEGYCEQ